LSSGKLVRSIKRRVTKPKEAKFLPLQLDSDDYDPLLRQTVDDCHEFYPALLFDQLHQPRLIARGKFMKWTPNLSQRTLPPTFHSDNFLLPSTMLSSVVLVMTVLRWPVHSADVKKQYFAIVVVLSDNSYAPKLAMPMDLQDCAVPTPMPHDTLPQLYKHCLVPVESIMDYVVKMGLNSNAASKALKTQAVPVDEGAARRKRIAPRKKISPAQKGMFFFLQRYIDSCCILLIV